jgi:hypothetical protein
MAYILAIKLTTYKIPNATGIQPPQFFNFLQTRQPVWYTKLTRVLHNSRGGVRQPPGFRFLPLLGKRGYISFDL